MRMKTSSWRHMLPGLGRRRFSALANSRPKRKAHSWILSQDTTTPRAARMVSTSRRLRLLQ